MWCHSHYVTWWNWLGGSNCCSWTGWVAFIGWWAIAFVLHSFCIYILITIIVIICFFAFLLNCLYLNTQVFTCFPFSSPSHGREERGCERAAVWCLVAGCRVKPRHAVCPNASSAVRQIELQQLPGCIWESRIRIFVLYGLPIFLLLAVCMTQ